VNKLFYTVEDSEELYIHKNALIFVELANRFQPSIDYDNDVIRPSRYSLPWTLDMQGIAQFSKYVERELDSSFVHCVFVVISLCALHYNGLERRLCLAFTIFIGNYYCRMVKKIAL